MNECLIAKVWTLEDRLKGSWIEDNRLAREIVLAEVRKKSGGKRKKTKKKVSILSMMTTEQLRMFLEKK